MYKYLTILVALVLVVISLAEGAETQASTQQGAATKATPTATTASGGAYTMTDIGTLGFDTYGLAINASGQITGYSYTTAEVQYPCPKSPDYPTPKKCFENPNHAFLWSNGTMTDLGTLGGNFSQGTAINRSGEVTGTADTSSGPADAFLWNGGKSLIDIGAWTPAGINDSGQLAGECYNASGVCLYSNGKLTQLPNPTSFPSSGCNGGLINNNSQVLGSCSDTSGNTHVVVWQNGTATDLGTIGAGPPYEGNSVSAINNLGHVVGYQQISTGAVDGFLLSNGKITDLGANFLPKAINDNDVVVGGPFIWSGGTLQNLNDLIPPGSGFTLADANGINNNGQIVVTGYNAQGYYHTFLLTPR
jgi:probable HAF family extracellular repeat protein